LSGCRPRCKAPGTNQVSIIAAGNAQRFYLIELVD
jgi:hypothetical protein